MCVCVCQSTDADVMAGPAEDGGSEQERERSNELHEGTEWGCTATSVSAVRFSLWWAGH